MTYHFHLMEFRLYDGPSLATKDEFSAKKQ